MRASAAKDLALLNNAHAVALLGGCKGGFLAGRTIADDDETILWLFRRHQYPSLPWPTEQGTQARCFTLADAQLCV
jgi:hypothetical protein